MSNITIHETAYVHPSVILEGKITIGKYTRIEAGTIISGPDIVIGDYCRLFLNIAIRGWGIKIGNYVNIFDNANIESGRGGEYNERALIGDWCWINHGSVMHGSVIGENVVVGMNAALNYGCKIGDGTVIMEGSACGVGMQVPPNCMVQGVPARVVRASITDEDRMKHVGLLPKYWIQIHADENERMANERLNKQG